MSRHSRAVQPCRIIDSSRALLAPNVNAKQDSRGYRFFLLFFLSFLSSPRRPLVSIGDDDPSERERDVSPRTRRGSKWRRAKLIGTIPRRIFRKTDNRKQRFVGKKRALLSRRERERKKGFKVAIYSGEMKFLRSLRFSRRIETQCARGGRSSNHRRLE